MIKKLHLYLLREFLGSFLFGILVFSILLILNLVFDRIDFFVSGGIGFFLILKIFALSIINTLTLTIPMSIVFGILLSYGRLSSDSEFVAMRSLGVNYATLTMPIIIFVCIVSCLLMFFNHFLAPKINFKSRTILEEAIMRKPLVKFSEKSIIKLGPYNLYADKVNNENNVLYGVSVYKFTDKNNDNSKKNPVLDLKNKAKDILPQNDKGTWRITAASATIKTYTDSIQLTFHKGCWQNAHPSNMNEMVYITFETFVFYIPMKDLIKKNDSKTLTEIQSPKLLKIIEKHKKQKISTIELEREFWFRWIFTFAPLAFTFIALPIGMMAEKNGKSIGFVMSLAIILIYYVLLIIAVNLGKKEYISLKFVLWIPNIAITGLGIPLYRKMIKK